MDIERQIRDKMMKERVMFVYRGVVTSENSVPLLMLLEKEMENSDFGFVGRKRLFMFVLESLQNVSRHKEDMETANMSIVVYNKTDDGYSVSTGNVIASSNIPNLKQRLDEINNLQGDEIRTVYREMLSKSRFSEKGGAGLGLIEMAKKTGNKLDYDFLKINDEQSYFILNKTVNSEGIGSRETDGTSLFKGTYVAELEKIMSDNDIYMIWTGHITSEIGKEVISFNETKLLQDDAEQMQKRRVFSVLVEAIENISKYTLELKADDKLGMPMAILRLMGKSYSISTGNLILNKDVPTFKKKMDDINQYDKEGLKELFRESLSKQTKEKESTGNMGLIDMARKSGSKLIYSFEKINDTYSYFMLRVNVD